MRYWPVLFLLLLAAPPGRLTAAPQAPLFDPPTHLRFSAQEVSEAARARGEMAEPTAAPCDPACLRVQRIWQRLLPIALAQPHAQAITPHLQVTVAGSSPHARADGRVVFPLALAESLALSDAEIAFVLAHEMVHVLLEHEREILTAADALMRPDVRRTADDIYGALDHDLGLSLKTGFLMQAAELEADRFGLQLAALAGYEPAAQLSALDKLLDRRGPRRLLLPTHPSDAERLQHLRDALPLARAIYCRAAADDEIPPPAGCTPR